VTLCRDLNLSVSRNSTLSASLWLAIALLLVGEFFLVIMGAIIRAISEDISVIQIVFLRNLLSMIIILFSIWRMSNVSLSSNKHGLLFVRGLLGVTTMFCLYFAFSKVALAEVGAIKAMTPLIIPLFGVLLLAERINGLTLVALVLAFVATLIIIQPNSLGSSANMLAYFSAMAAAVLAALVKVIVRKLGATEPSSRIVFYFALYGSIATAPFAFWYWQPMQLIHWFALAVIALVATIGQVAVTRAFAMANAGVIGLFSYFSIPFAALLGWWFWGDSITQSDLLGMLLLFGAGGIGVVANEQRGYRRPASFNR
jgi:drug/metabolite transporter (DMT)-like permease